MRTSIFIEAFPVDASIGVFDWEREIKQTLLFDVEGYYDFGAAMRSDAIADAISYVDLSDAIRDKTLSKHFALLEHLAGELCEHLMSRFPLEVLTLRISKPGAVPEAANVGVKVSLKREDL